MNTTLLEQDIEKMKYMIEHTSSKSKKAYYVNIFSVLNEILMDIKYKKIEYNIPNKTLIFLYKNLDNIMNSNRKQMMTEDYVKMVNTLTKNAKKHLKQIEYFEHFNSKYTLTETKEIILDFFKQYDPNSIFTVNQSLKNEHLFILNDYHKKGYGYSYFNNFSNHPYIVLFIDNDETKFSISDIICLVHEIGHIINFYTTSYNTKLYSKLVYNNFSEMPACTIEQLFIDYLLKCKIETNDVNKHLNNNLMDLKNWNNSTRMNNFIIKELPIQEIVEIETIQEILNKHGFYNDDDFVKTNFDNLYLNYAYTYGMLLSYYYFNMFKKNPELTKKHINDFNNCIGIMNDFYMLNNFGINLNEFISCNYLKDIVKENQKVLKIDSK